MSETNDNDKAVQASEPNNVVKQSTDNTKDSKSPVTPSSDEFKENTEASQNQLNNLINMVMSEMLFPRNGKNDSVKNKDTYTDEEDLLNTEEDEEDSLNTEEDEEDEEDLLNTKDEEVMRWQAFHKLLDTHLHMTKVFLRLLEEEK